MEQADARASTVTGETMLPIRPAQSDTQKYRGHPPGIPWGPKPYQTLTRPYRTPTTPYQALPNPTRPLPDAPWRPGVPYQTPVGGTF